MAGFKVITEVISFSPVVADPPVPSQKLLPRPPPSRRTMLLSADGWHFGEEQLNNPNLHLVESGSTNTGNTQPCYSLGVIIQSRLLNAVLSSPPKSFLERLTPYFVVGGRAE